jgi:putative ABC transport system substrate-binding protein
VLWRKSQGSISPLRLFYRQELKGTKPGDIPIEEPTTFELIVNNRVAKSLGLTLPMSIMISADESIE